MKGHAGGGGEQAGRNGHLKGVSQKLFPPTHRGPAPISVTPGRAGGVHVQGDEGMERAPLRGSVGMACWEYALGETSHSWHGSDHDLLKAVVPKLGANC
jgi:hypothetical protein